MHGRGELNPLLDTRESKGGLFSAQPGKLAAPHPADHTQAGGGRSFLLFLLLCAGPLWGAGMLAAKWHPGTVWGQSGQRERAVPGSAAHVN